MVPLFKYPKGRAKNYFALQQKTLKTLGVLFSGHESYLYRMYSILWLSSVVISFSVVELYEIYVYKDNMDVLVNNLSYLGTDLLGIAKMAVILYYRLDIGKMLKNMEKGLFSPDEVRGGNLEERLIKRCILLSNRQTCLYYLSVVMVCGFGVIGAMLKRILHADTRTWETPFVTFSLFNAKTSPIFELICLYQFFWRMFYALIVSSIDALIAGVLAHISTQCKILQNAVSNVVTNIHKEIFPENAKTFAPIPRHILAGKIKELVDYHTAIIDLAERFEELFNFLVLTIFLASLFILCFVMYHASLFELLSIKAAQDFSYVALLALQVFLYCYWGNEVRLESDRIANACWQTDFLDTDVQFQKSLCLMMRRCQKPIVLTAGKFTALSLDTYVWIIRVSYSYYMVLRNYHTK